jgi:hypothetical protein
MIAGGESDYAARALLLRQLNQAVGRPSQLERPAGLQAFALEPDAGAANLGFDQRRALDEAIDPPSGLDDVGTANLGLS